jgi:hypothetical protein
MQKMHLFDAERPFVGQALGLHYARRETRNVNDVAASDAFLKIIERRSVMTARVLRRKLARPAAKMLARPREMFGESLPELLLLTAVVATVVSAVLTLNSAG